MKTIIATMTKDDRISLVQFNQAGSVLLELTSMDTTGKDKANRNESLSLCDCLGYI